MFLQTSVLFSDLYAAIMPYLVSVVSMLAAAFVAWLGKQLNEKWGLDIEAKHREALQTALENAAGLIAQKAGAALEGKKIDISSPLVAAGVNYVRDAVPDAVKKFGLTPESIAEKLAAKIGAAKL